ncbi:MAG: hypothetical protein EOM37_01740 [Proteobacteria bacterium]|jgi:hypothetical protein|nr:hypothetical protein [Alphaproteobacteria bacterium]NCC02759.1 hypothetical protein [Pseudomonadota bacterium]
MNRLYPSCPLFPPAQSGHVIEIGYSYLQRIGKNPQSKIWVPDNKPPSFPLAVEWAAVRQFEILQEADNLAIDDLDVMDLKRTFSALRRMHAGGYSLTVITLGRYTDQREKDDLALLDLKLQKEIAQLIHFLYLRELSEKATRSLVETVRHFGWNLPQALPHIAKAILAKRMFKPECETQTEKLFFSLLDKIPQGHVTHETSVGLVLPEATKEENQPYIVAGENSFLTFHQTLASLFRPLDDKLPVMRHMPGYGQRDLWTRSPSLV